MQRNGSKLRTAILEAAERCGITRHRLAHEHNGQKRGTLLHYLYVGNRDYQISTVEALMDALELVVISEKELVVLRRLKQACHLARKPLPPNVEKVLHTTA